MSPFERAQGSSAQVLHVLRTTPKNAASPAEGSVGDDKLLGPGEYWEDPPKKTEGSVRAPVSQMVAPQGPFKGVLRFFLGLVQGRSRELVAWI